MPSSALAGDSVEKEQSNENACLGKEKLKRTLNRLRSHATFLLVLGAGTTEMYERLGIRPAS